MTEDDFWDFMYKDINSIDKGSTLMTFSPPQPLCSNSITVRTTFQHEFLGGTQTFHLWQKGWCGGSREGEAGEETSFSISGGLFPRIPMVSKLLGDQGSYIMGHRYPI